MLKESWRGTTEAMAFPEKRCNCSLSLIRAAAHSREGWWTYLEQEEKNSQEYVEYNMLTYRKLGLKLYILNFNMLFQFPLTGL